MTERKIQGSKEREIELTIKKNSDIKKGFQKEKLTDAPCEKNLLEEHDQKLWLHPFYVVVDDEVAGSVTN